MVNKGRYGVYLKLEKKTINKYITTNIETYMKQKWNKYEIDYDR